MKKLFLAIFILALLVGSIIILNLRVESAQAPDLANTKALSEISKGFAAIVKSVEPSVVSISVEGERARRGERREERREPRERRERNEPRQFREWRREFRWPDDWQEFWRRQPEPQDLQDRPSRPFPLPNWPVQPEQIFRDKPNIGSGIVIKSDGHIITSIRLVGGAARIHVRFSDGSEKEAKLVASDRASNLALIKVEATKLPQVKFGDSDKLELGELVVSVANFGKHGKGVNFGVVGGLNIQGVEGVDHGNLIQTSIFLDENSNGGALVNAKGEVVGIIVASDEARRLSFALPINSTRKIADDLMSKGKVSHGWLGVSIQSIDENIAGKYGLDKPKGALVNEVLKDSPAEAAKIQKGDIIIEFDGNSIADAAELRSLVGMTEPGKQVKLKVIREKVEKVIEVKIGERSDSEPRAGVRRGEDLKGITFQEDWQGIIVQELTPELAKRFGYEGQEGVLVSEVKPNSPASKAGLQRGDLIQEIEKKPVKNLDDYNEAIKSAKSPTLLYIKRGIGALFVTINY